MAIPTNDHVPWLLEKPTAISMMKSLTYPMIESKTFKAANIPGLEASISQLGHMPHLPKAFVAQVMQLFKSSAWTFRVYA